MVRSSGRHLETLETLETLQILEQPGRRLNQISAQTQGLAASPNGLKASHQKKEE